VPTRAAEIRGGYDEESGGFCDRSRTAFAVVPSGNIKAGCDIIPDMLSLTLAYNYLYMSSVGRVGDQITSPFGITQSSFFAQGITLGAKAKF
jgi:hypothetical protein